MCRRPPRRRRRLSPTLLAGRRRLKGSGRTRSTQSPSGAASPAQRPAPDPARRGGWFAKSYDSADSGSFRRPRAPHPATRRRRCRKRSAQRQAHHERYAIRQAKNGPKCKGLRLSDVQYPPIQDQWQPARLNQSGARAICTTPEKELTHADPRPHFRRPQPADD